MTEEEFAEWLSQIQLDKHWKVFYEWYVEAWKFDALVEYGVDNWSGYGDAMQSLDNEILIND